MRYLVLIMQINSLFISSSLLMLELQSEIANIVNEIAQITISHNFQHNNPPKLLEKNNRKIM